MTGPTREVWPHIILDGYMGDRERLDDQEYVEMFLESIPNVLGMNVLYGPKAWRVTEDDKKGEPGVTGISIITTSHIAIHTFPLAREACMDIFSCKDFDGDLVEESFTKTFKFDKVYRRFLLRGRSLMKSIVERGDG
jgi:S-adenosylmethionine decarboxylase